MVLDFGVTNNRYRKALEEFRKVKITPEHWESVLQLIKDEEKKSAERIKSLQVDDELLHRRFTL